ncbi:MAG: STAS domain-containing protein [Chloroflexota bacterium]
MAATALDVAFDGVVAHVSPGQQIDSAAAGELQAACALLVDQGVARYAVDLSQVTCLDSDGLVQLLRLARHANQMGGSLVLHSASSDALRAIEITCLDRVFPLYPDRSTAIQALSSADPGMVAAA